MTVTDIRSARRQPTLNTPRPGSPEFLELQAAKWPEYAVELLAAAAELRADTSAKAA